MPGGAGLRHRRAPAPAYLDLPAPLLLCLVAALLCLLAKHLCPASPAGLWASQPAISKPLAFCITGGHRGAFGFPRRMRRATHGQYEGACRRRPCTAICDLRLILHTHAPAGGAQGPPPVQTKRAMARRCAHGARLRPTDRCNHTFAPPRRRPEQGGPGWVGWEQAGGAAAGGWSPAGQARKGCPASDDKG
ncbi:MAG: hypothetical protein J3K34DRAFT_170809 [Monoraphidium minutum]|nr:MAG: hypothetical protein J3K34DRAFT_170809 [Monoraphidium minutum]